MTIRINGFRTSRIAALLCAFAMFAVACGGTTTTTITADRAAIPPASIENLPEYGTSLDEWEQESPAPQAAPATAHGQEPSLSAVDTASEQTGSTAATILWQDLIPPGFSGQEVVERYSERLEAVEPGTAEATALYEEMQAEFDDGAVNTDLEGQEIRLAGFVAPLTYEDDVVTEFLLVPTFGACIHVPPPPPNQTVLVSVDKADGLTNEEAWGPVWVEGTLTLDTADTSLASASYTITNATSGVYEV